MIRCSRCLILAIVLQAARAPAADQEQPEFSRDVQPILEAACIKCHGSQKQQGGLRFDDRDGALKAGDSGLPAITPGRIGQSELIRRVEATDKSERMPLDLPPLTPGQIATLRAWIERGADWPAAGNSRPATGGEMVVTDEDRRHWSYRPLRGVQLPAIGDAS